MKTGGQTCTHEAGHRNACQRLAVGFCSICGDARCADHLWLAAAPHCMWHDQIPERPGDGCNREVEARRAEMGCGKPLERPPIER